MKHRTSQHFLFVFSLVLALASCTFSERISDAAVEYNKSVAAAATAQMLLYILRERDRHPEKYTGITQVRGSYSQSTTGNLSIVIPFGGDATSVFPLTPSLSVSQSSKPSFDVAVFEGPEFTKGILAPVDMQLLEYYWQQRWPKEMLLHLFIHKVEIHEKKKNAKGEEEDILANTLVNSPRRESSDFRDFQEWVRCQIDAGLTIETPTTVRKIGPPIPASELHDLEKLVLAEKEKLRLFKIPVGKKVSCKIATDLQNGDKKPSGNANQTTNTGRDTARKAAKEDCYQLCKVSSSPQICYGSCEEPKSIAEACTTPRPKDGEPQAEEGATTRKKARITIFPLVTAREKFEKEFEKVDEVEKKVTEKINKCLGIVEKGKGNRPDTSFVAHIRSLENMIYYLGANLKTETDYPEKKVLVNDAYREKLVHLFTLKEWDSGRTKPPLSVDYGGKTYYVDEDMSKTVLGLISQLFELQKKGEKLPATTAVTIVGE